MTALIGKLRDVRLVRYLAVSVVALAVDVACFLLLLTAGVAPTVASAIGYSAGIVIHWILSSRTVFTDGIALRGIRRTRQKGLFVISALAGLALTITIVGAADVAHVDPRLAKLAAIAASFALTWLLRSRFIFRPRAN
ncbi:MAG: GtrA family protein [Alteraurantiacibacter sp.]